MDRNTYASLFESIEVLQPALAAALAAPNAFLDTTVAAEVAMPTTAPCPRCNGSGRFKVGAYAMYRKDLGPCFRCEGSGRVPLRAQAAPDDGPAVDADALHKAFALAKLERKSRPRITLGEVTVKPAPAAGKNPGAIYVTDSDSDAYLGKVVAGRFVRATACTSEQADRVATLINDPKAAAEAYGRETGICCICSLTLTNPDSIARGIGPICAARFGW